MCPHRIIIVSKGADLSLNSPISTLFVVLQILGDFINSLTAGVLFAIIVQTALSTSEFYVFIFLHAIDASTGCQNRWNEPIQAEANVIVQ